MYLPHTDIPDNFMTSVSANGGLTHVIMLVSSLTIEGRKSLIRNSPKLIILTLDAFKEDQKENIVEIQKIFYSRRLNSNCHCSFLPSCYWDCITRHEQHTDFFPAW